MEIFAETERLIMRELLPGDDRGMFELDSDPEVHRYLGKRPVKSIEESRTVIQIIRQQYIDNGIGRWAAIEKASGNFIGWTGLKLMKERTNGHVDYLDLGYRFIKKYWGKGYATETAQAALEYGFIKMKQPAIYAMADVNNLGSQNVLLKCGLKRGTEFEYDGEKHYWFEISKENWLRSKITGPVDPDTRYKEAIYKLWNEEYPSQLMFSAMPDLDAYLTNLKDANHFFMEIGKIPIAWAFVFTRENERWFAVIVHSAFHKSGIGKVMLEQLKATERVLNGWVIDHDNYRKTNSELYASPIPFYEKSGFKIHPLIRLETDKLTAVKISWTK